MGIGMTLFEETVFDPVTGRIANATLADYLIPVSADIPDLDVVFVGEPDTSNPIGIKGLGEIGIVGVSAAIANAVYHATGRRISSLPITVEQLLGPGAQPGRVSVSAQRPGHQHQRQQLGRRWRPPAGTADKHQARPRKELS